MSLPPGRPPSLPITPYQPPSLPPSHGYSVSSAALLAGTPRVTSIPSNLPSYSRDPNAPQPVAAVNNNTNIYARNPNAPRVPVLQSPYLAGEASRPQQYANQNNQGRNPDGSFAGAAGSGAGVGAGGPGSRGPYQKKGPGPFAVPRQSIRTRRDETGGREEGESELTES